ncbi:MAG: lytic transglycosylase domain-containing protein [Burkholderiales bacterium]|nr:lytic transglycosylase domain-containing protein [Burkholderiales bacterium]MDE1926657.1 lytic transglycosylase domain-containing protein [Burkholderiales bacterium]MDE2158702.1 lytic transglycosylase domain-containing protein [Burkholderiales bacterium]
MRTIAMLRQAQRSTAKSLFVFVRDVGHGFLEISHNTLALVGLAAIALLVVGFGRADMRGEVENVAFKWLQTRHDEREISSGNIIDSVSDHGAVARATATDLSELTRQQAALANWISRRYRVAPEPIGALVKEAWSIGKRAGLDPTLILAIMAVESSFNPFAQSNVGAQGLMQVMTRVHDDKYEAFGGTRAAFDPISNLRVGVQVLKDCIARAGGVQAGLRYYVGAALIDNDGGYAGRVMAEQAHMRDVADGKRVPVNIATPLVAVAPTAVATPASDAAPADATAPPPSAAAAADDKQLALAR